jgi:hypothetical protein
MGTRVGDVALPPDHRRTDARGVLMACVYGYTP